MNSQPNILIVDDDPDIRMLLAEYLENNGCLTTTAPDGEGMWRALGEHAVDLIVLDLNLPGKDGLTLCRELRVKSDIPVIMLTARDATLDRIVGLEMGADDYLGKPFEPRELLSRIRTVLRRIQAPREQQAAEPEQLRFAGWTLDLTARHLINPQGVIVSLSSAEFRLLKIFATHPNHVLNRDQILNMTQGRDADPFDRSIDLQVSRLRQKLGEDARTPQLIKTVRNEGYVLAAQVSR
ncbi:two-component system [Novimethylophilus kurashikiensis]|uniref:Two-component system n=1 Tax=Novimethylophilus kurashikiensis TaxID=1825523 RepID=A0A2R5F2X2_9PROT|nr:response regulator [Novimethylophilus kurashikiensis]GBG12519.1 two-component system [Novimethylophilus kurashikiensis]